MIVATAAVLSFISASYIYKRRQHAMVRQAVMARRMNRE